jgi:hypothetical protein
MGLKETWEEINKDRLKTLLIAIEFLIGVPLTAVFWFDPMLKVYIFKIWSVLFIVSVIIGGVVREKTMKEYEIVARFLGLIIAMFFVFGGMGTSLSIATGNQNMNLMMLSVENNLSDILSAMFGNISIGIVVVFTILGSIIINMGDAENNPDAYRIGAAAIATPITVLGIFHFLGWIAPAPVFLVFGAAAPIISAAAVVVVGVFIAYFGFMFDGMITSPTAGE